MQVADRLFANITQEIVNPLLTLIFVLALVYFLWGVFTFIRNAEDGEKRKEGAQHILWGVVGMFIMVSAYGIINLIAATLR